MKKKKKKTPPSQKLCCTPLYKSNIGTNWLVMSAIKCYSWIGLEDHLHIKSCTNWIHKSLNTSFDTLNSLHQISRRNYKLYALNVYTFTLHFSNCYYKKNIKNEFNIEIICLPRIMVCTLIKFLPQRNILNLINYNIILLCSITRNFR